VGPSDFLHGLLVTDGLLRSMERGFTENDSGKWLVEYYYVTKHAAISVPADKADPRYADAERRCKEIGINAKKRRTRLTMAKSAEVAALRLYTGPPHQPINAALRALMGSLCYSAVCTSSLSSRNRQAFTAVSRRPIRVSR